MTLKKWYDFDKKLFKIVISCDECDDMIYVFESEKISLVKKAEHDGAVRCWYCDVVFR